MFTCVSFKAIAIHAHSHIHANTHTQAQHFLLIAGLSICSGYEIQSNVAAQAGRTNQALGQVLCKEAVGSTVDGITAAVRGDEGRLGY